MPRANIQELLENAGKGDRAANSRLYLLAFPRLRSIASRLLRHERPGHTLQPTALVGELFLKLRRFESRVTSDEHFFRVAARAMKQVLIDHGRVHGLRKSMTRESLADSLREFAHPAGDAAQDLAVRDIFERLRRADPRAARVIWLRAVEGCTWDEVSAKLGREVWRLRDDYDFGVQWMASRLRASDSSSKPATRSAQAKES